MEYFQRVVDVGMGILVDVKFLHKGKQPELIHTNELFGPSLFPFWVPGIVMGLGGKGVVEVRNSGHVPGAGDHGTYEKTARVVDKVGDNHFDDIQGKPDGGSQGRHRSQGRRRS